MRLFSWLLAVAVTTSAMHAAFATTKSQVPDGAWTTAQLSVARLGSSTGRVDHDMVALQLQQQSHHADDIIR